MSQNTDLVANGSFKIEINGLYQHEYLCRFLCLKCGADMEIIFPNSIRCPKCDTKEKLP